MLPQGRIGVTLLIHKYDMVCVLSRTAQLYKGPSVEAKAIHPKVVYRVTGMVLQRILYAVKN
jgi:hypothetical protein